MAEMTVAVMSEQDARKLTNRIVKGAENLRDLLLEAHDGGAAKALGYKSWNAYLAGEFEISPGHATRLLTQAKAIKELSAVTGLPPAEVAAALSERVVRDLSPDDLAQVAADTRGAALIDRGQKMRDSVAEHRQGHGEDETRPRARGASSDVSDTAKDEAPPAPVLDEPDDVLGEDEDEPGDEDETTDSSLADKEKSDEAFVAGEVGRRAERRAAINRANLPTEEGAEHKVAQAAKVIQQLLALPPVQVAKAYLKIPDAERTIHVDVIPALVEAWAQAFADEIAPF